MRAVSEAEQTRQGYRAPSHSARMASNQQLGAHENDKEKTLTHSAAIVADSGLKCHMNSMKPKQSLSSIIGQGAKLPRNAFHGGSGRWLSKARRSNMTPISG